MSKLIKVFIGVVSSIVLVLFVGTIALTYVIQPEFVKKQATKWFDEQTDRHITIQGDVHWSFFPHLGLAAENIVISNPSSFGNEPFLIAKKMTFNLSIRELVHKKIAIKQLQLDDVTLNLTKDSSGKENWDIQFRNKPKDNENQNNTDGKEKKSAEYFNIKKVVLNDSNIRFQNLQTAKDISFSKVNLTTNGIDYTKPIFVYADAHVNSKKPDINSDISLNGKIQYDNNTEILTLNDFEFSMNNANNPIRTLSIHTSGNVDFKNATFEANSIEYEYAKAMAGRGRVSGSDFYAHPKISGHITTNSFDLKSLLGNLGYPLQKADKLRNVMIDGGFEMTPDQLALQNFRIRVDNTSMKSSLIYRFANNSATVDLQGGALTLSDFTNITVQKKNENKTLNPEQKDKDSNQSLKIDGRFKFNTIKTSATTLSDVDSAFSYTKGVLQLTKMTASIFGGKTSGAITLNTNTDPISYNLNQSMTDINMGVLLSELIQSRPITGTAKIQINVSGSGTEPALIKRNLKGSASLNLANGVANGVDIEYQFARVIGYLSKSVVAKSDTHQTIYQSANSQLQFNEGIATTPTFEMTLPKFHIKGDGKLNLTNEHIRYKVYLKSLTPVEIDTPISSTDLADYYIPLQVSGTLTKPEPSLNFPGIAAITLKEAAKEVLKVPEKSNELLKNVINSPVGEALKKPITDTLKSVFSSDE